VRIESFYSTKDPAVEAIVRVYKANGEPLLPAGVTDELGIYEFSWVRAEDLKVAVSQDGHRKEISIPASDLVPSAFLAPAVAVVGDRPEGLHLAEIMAGLSLILASAAFFLSIKTALRLKKVPTTPLSSPETPLPAPPPTAPVPR
jgi:hypothetical protein